MMTEVMGNEAHELYRPYDITNFPGSRNYSTDQFLTLGYLTSKLARTSVDVATISDRSPLNLESIADHGVRFGSLNLRGVVLSGGELDQDIERIMAFESILRAAYDGEPEQMERIIGFGQAAEPVDRGDFILQRGNPVTDAWEDFFRVAHEPYDASKLRASDGESNGYRDNLGHRIVNHLDRIDPDIIFLDNYKVILPANVVRAFAGKMINVHPSVLPLIKGYRPEKRAFEGEHPEANGYTIHVVSEDLDGGPTLLQQRVPVLPFDQDLFNQMGEEAYSTYREEQARTRVMVAQAPFVPWALHIYGSDLDRKIVEDQEAFRAEGRPDFSQTKAYKEARSEDPASGPYQRVIFENPLAANARDDQPKYVTLEQMLSAPATAEVSPHIDGIHHYDFSLPAVTEPSSRATLTDIEYMVQELREMKIPATIIQQSITFNEPSVALRSLTNCIDRLLAMDIRPKYRQQRVHVQTPRVPVASRAIHYTN